MRPIVLLKKKNKCKTSRDHCSKKLLYRVYATIYSFTLFTFYYPIDYKPNFNRANPHFDALVMTSGNISEEPIITKNEEAFEKLQNVTDAFLIHNREIFMRVDDSVVRELNGKIYFIRRARGFVPKAIQLKEEIPEVLGVGADLKNTFTLIKSNYAIMSQHIGDMENIETVEFLRKF